MIKAITVENFRGEILKMELTNPDASGVIVQEATGIGAGEANINTAESVYIDGSSFNSSRLTSRNIVLSLLPMDTPSVEKNRHKIYHFFPSKKPVKLYFEIDSGTRVIEGYTESNEPEIFSERETQQISILCPDPYFYDSNYTEQALSGYESLFEFPFSNESLSENLLVFDNANTTRYATINYAGDGDTGVIMKMTMRASVKNIKVVNIQTGETMFLNTDMLPTSVGTQFEYLDYVEIGTFMGNRYATLTRGDQVYNIINCLGRHTDWFSLVSGENTFYFEASLNQNYIDVSVSYRNVYMGV